LEDGSGADRHTIRLPRVRHGLKRLVIIGSDGFVSLSALRWLADQQAGLVMLERDGKVLAVTGPVSPSDARLRRAQALAGQSGIALQITKELISQKLAGQEQNAREWLLHSTAAQTIARFKDAIQDASTIQEIRIIESRGAHAYWSAWHALPINFPKKDMRRVPDHWCTFGTRISPLSGSPRLAVNPPNAILNYLYALLESESRLAAVALGLDPGLGVMHADGPVRDSLACDLMEPVRPKIDAYVLDWITRDPLKRDWFFEQRTNGNCRLMGSFAVRLSETAPTWGRAVAPFAEWVARALWGTTRKSTRERPPATRLTQRTKREAKGSEVLSAGPAPRPQFICRVCGAQIGPERTYCASCVVSISKENIVKVAHSGRVAAQSSEARTRRKETKHRQDLARQGWLASSQPAWLNNKTYLDKIQPRLAGITYSAIASALHVSLPYAADIRAGRRRPHPRHWQALAELVGISADAGYAGKSIAGRKGPARSFNVGDVTPGSALDLENTSPTIEGRR